MSNHYKSEIVYKTHIHIHPYIRESVLTFYLYYLHYTLIYILFPQYLCLVVLTFYLYHLHYMPIYTLLLQYSSLVVLL